MQIKDVYKINDNQELKFKKYLNLLVEWNNKINLTSITEENDIILKHFIDSLTASEYIPDNSKIIDIGTGAGFPGIPLKIYNETYNITLLDSLNKRVNFLNTVIEELELKNISAIHGRAEEFGHNTLYREKYDIAISRAVSNLSTLVEYMLPFIKKDGLCICMKGPNIKEEIDNSKNALKRLGGKIIKIEEFNLPNTDIKRNIIIIKKILNTDNKYPRKAGIPNKNPL